MIQIQKETAFVAVENHGDPIWGGFRLYVVHKQKRDRWQISPLINEEDLHAIQPAFPSFYTYDWRIVAADGHFSKRDI
jgi:methionine-rich copper-binding protein CopC